MGECPREVVAVFVHQVVAVAAELFAQLLQDLVDVGRLEVGVAQPDGDLEAELFPQVGGGPGRDVEHAGERERVAPVSVLAAVHLQPRVVHSQPDVASVVICPDEGEEETFRITITTSFEDEDFCILF